MKNINFKKQECFVEDIPVGECFIYAGELFMVVETLKDEDCEEIICVNLSNGTIPSQSYIYSGSVVTPVNINIDVL